MVVGRVGKSERQIGYCHLSALLRTQGNILAGPRMSRSRSHAPSIRSAKQPCPPTKSERQIEDHHRLMQDKYTILRQIAEARLL